MQSEIVCTHFIQKIKLFTWERIMNKKCHDFQAPSDTHRNHFVSRLIKRQHSRCKAIINQHWNIERFSPTFYAPWQKCLISLFVDLDMSVGFLVWNVLCWIWQVPVLYWLLCWKMQWWRYFIFPNMNMLRFALSQVVFDYFSR